MTSFEECTCQENLNRMMTEEEIEEVEVNVVDQEPGTYMEAPVAEFENASSWVDTVVGRLQMPFVTASQPTIILLHIPAEESGDQRFDCSWTVLHDTTHGTNTTERCCPMR